MKNKSLGDAKIKIKNRILANLIQRKLKNRLILGRTPFLKSKRFDFILF